MKEALFVIGCLGAGLIGAVGGSLLTLRATRVQEPSEAPAPMESRIKELERRVDSLSEELRAVRIAPLLPDPIPAIAPASEPEAMDAPPSQLPVADATEAAIEEKVREVIEERAKEAREEQTRKKLAAQLKKQQDWLAKIQPELGLTNFQMEELSKLLARRQAFMVEYGMKWKAAGTEEGRSAVKQQAADFGRELDAELRSLLSASQYDGLMERAKADRKR